MLQNFALNNTIWKFIQSNTLFYLLLDVSALSQVGIIASFYSTNNSGQQWVTLQIVQKITNVPIKVTYP